MEEPGGLQSMGSLRVGQDSATSLSLFTFMHWRRKCQQHTPVFLPGESQGRGSLVGCSLWGHRVGHDWRNLAAAPTAAVFGFFCFYLKMNILKSLCSVTESCPTLCNPVDCSMPARLLCPEDFPRQEYWSISPVFPPEDLPGIYRFFTTAPLGKPNILKQWFLIYKQVCVCVRPSVTCDSLQPHGL